MSAHSISGNLSRRKFTKPGTGIIAAGGMAQGGWGLTEIIVDKGTVNTWHKKESYTANKLFKAGLHTNNMDGNPGLCMASAAVGYTRTFGKTPGGYDGVDH